MAVNVNRSVLDPFYRYKMPRLQAKVEGKGNGIKTVIANMSEIAKALDRPPTYATKYFGCELGAQTNFDMKNERYIVNGEHDANKLQEILDGFIKKFVLCPDCDNPETILQVRKGQIHSACKACGYTGIMSSKHKLITFILKHPPPKSEELAKKENAGTPTEENADNGIEAPNNDNGRLGSSEEENDNWDPEPLADDYKPDRAIGAEMAKLTMNKDLEKSMEERLDMLHKYLQEAKKSGKLEDSRTILNEAERLELKTKAPLLLCDVIFDANIIAQVKQYRTLLLRFTNEDRKAQRFLLGGIEQTIVRQKDKLLPKSAVIVKTFYDADILDEETLLTWKASSKFVSKDESKLILTKADPVLKWLREAEEESDENDEFETVFDDRSREAGTVQVKEPPEVAAQGSAKADDLDIDDI